MNCNNKIKQTCGPTTYATCVEYELNVNPNSSLTEEPCLTISETTQDIYTQLEDIDEQINLSALGQNVLLYVKDAKDRIVVKNVLIKYEQEIEELKEKVFNLETTDICSKSLVECDINFYGLLDECENPVVTLKDALQVLFNQTQIS